MTANIPIRMSCGLYDRMVALYTREVKPDGLDLTFIPNDDPRDLFDRLTRSSEFDVAEMSSSEYISRTCNGDRTFVALPVFPSRLFRHGFITINRRSGITRPKDLEGRRLGVQLHTMTAAIVIRGLLQHEYDVDLSTIRWLQGAIEKPGAHGDPSVPRLLKPIDLEINTSQYSLSELLERREIDGIIGATLPPALSVNPDVQRLFPDYAAIEADYYRRTRIFPVMHLIVVRRSVYEEHPFIAKSLFDAFSASKALAVKRLHFFGALRCTLPWQMEAVEQMDRVFGADPWPYGVDANRPTLKAQVSWMVEQFLIPAAPALEDLFLRV